MLAGGRRVLIVHMRPAWLRRLGDVLAQKIMELALEGSGRRWHHLPCRAAALPQGACACPADGHAGGRRQTRLDDAGVPPRPAEHADGTSADIYEYGTEQYDNIASACSGKRFEH